MKRLLLAAIAAISLWCVPSVAQVPFALTPIPYPQFFDLTGVPLSGGKLFTFLAGTTTPSNTFTTIAGNVANANPIILDVGGFPSSSGNKVGIYLAAHSYKFVLKDANDVVQWTADNVADSAQLLQIAYMTSFTTGTLTANTIHILLPGSTCGNNATASTGVMLLCDQIWTNPNLLPSDEVRGISVASRRVQTLADNGADDIAVTGAVTIESGTLNGATILGTQVGVRGENYTSSPAGGGSYISTSQVGVQATFPVLGSGSTTTLYAGMFASTPCHAPGGPSNGCYPGGQTGGSITYGYNIVAQGITSPTVTLERAAIKVPARGQDGRYTNIGTYLEEDVDGASIPVRVFGGGPIQLGAITGGFVDTSGTFVTYTSGATFTSPTYNPNNAALPFASTWNGLQISINSVVYTISSVTDATHLTLTGSAGTQFGVSYSVTDTSQLRLPYQTSAPTITGFGIGELHTVVSSAHSPLESTVYYCDGSNNCVDVLSGGGGGGGSVNNITVGNLSPVFTSAVATPTGPTAAVTFAFINANPYSFLSRTLPTAGSPSYNTISTVSPKSDNYTVSCTTDFGAWFSLANAGAKTLTLPATECDSGFFIDVQVTPGSAGTWTVSRNGLNIDGGTVNPSLAPGEGIRIASRGASFGYYTMRGQAATGGGGACSSATDCWLVATTNIGGNTNGADTWFGTTDAFGVGFSTNSTEAMWLDTSQHLGIGTHTATRRLTVQDTSGIPVRLIGAASGSVGGQIELYETSTLTGSIGWASGVTIATAAATTNPFSVFTNSGLGLKIDSNQRMTINTGTAFGSVARLTVAQATADGIGLAITAPSGGSQAKAAFIFNGVDGLDVYADGGNAHISALVGNLYLGGGSFSNSVNVQAATLPTLKFTANTTDVAFINANTSALNITTSQSSSVVQFGSGNSTFSAQIDGAQRWQFGTSGGATDTSWVTIKATDAHPQLAIDSPSSSNSKIGFYTNGSSTGYILASPAGAVTVVSGSTSANLAATTFASLNSSGGTYQVSLQQNGVFGIQLFAFASLPAAPAAGIAICSNCQNVKQDGVVAGSSCALSVSSHIAFAAYLGGTVGWVCF